MTLDRPLVFVHECPTIIVVRDLAVKLKRGFVSRRVLFASEPFFSFERIRFPGKTREDVEGVLDEVEREERMQ